MKLNAYELRRSKAAANNLKSVKRSPIYFVLDNIIDTYNIGSLFRLGDAVAVEKIYICGESEYPPSAKIHKAAVGTEAWVPWTKCNSTLETVIQLKKDGVFILAVEQSPHSVHYALCTMHLKWPVAIVVGNETTGVSKEVLDEADLIVELPMLGVNKSFNVWGSAAVVAYQVISAMPPAYR